LVATEFKKDVDVVGVFEEMLELDYILVLDAPVNFDFTHQLLLGPASGDTSLLDHFGCVVVIIVLVQEGVALGKSAFA